MSKFIEVTNSEGKVLVNVDKILYVSDHTTNACIRLGEKVALHVKETYQEIKAMLEVVNDQREPPAPTKYFSYDHHGNGIEYHDTAEEAKNHAQECLDSYTQNGGIDDIDICWGEIKESVHSIDAVLELKPIGEAGCNFDNLDALKESLLLVLDEMHKVMEKERNSCSVDQTIQQPESNNGD